MMWGHCSGSRYTCCVINTFGLTELVSDALGNRKQKEEETNVKIVDLLKNVIDDTKNVARLPSDSPKSHVFFLSIGLVESVVVRTKVWL